MGSLLDNSGLQLQADVLVIGGGPAAAWAAWSAAKHGAKTIVVDKGYLGTSGSAAASGNGVMAVPPNGEAREAVTAERYLAGKFLANSRWIERVLEKTWQSMPLIEEFGYRFPKENGQTVRRSYYGPEYMRVMRRAVQKAGVQILDQSPALELLVDHDGAVAGARGIQRQENRPWTIRAGAVVIATGGCAFLSKALGCNTNTGEGLLMAAEAGGELSSMEFSSQYAISSAFNATVTRGVPFGWATYTDEEGNDLGGVVNGRRGASFLQKALLNGPVYAKLDKATPEVKKIIERSHFIAFLPFEKAGIDPYTQRFPVTMVLEGTVRGTGGIRVINDFCGTTVPGLFAAGDAATRELLAGAGSGGGGPNAAWTISSGQWAGQGAAKHAALVGKHANDRKVREAGQAGIRPNNESGKTFNSDEIIKGVQDEILPLDKNYFRSEQGLLSSLAKLNRLWQALKDGPAQTTSREVQRSREAAALVTVARWAYFSGLERRETRSIQIRTDYPELDPNQRHYLVSGGFDKLWVRPEPVTEPIVSRFVEHQEAVAV